MKGKLDLGKLPFCSCNVHVPAVAINGTVAPDQFPICSIVAELAGDGVLGDIHAE
jgi:hypothetical protein